MAWIALFVFFFPSIAQTPTEPVTYVNIQEVKENIRIPDVLLRIANCESWNRQFDEKGNVIRGNTNKHDIGRFQINEIYWGKKAKELDYDIYTWNGNTHMALYIYHHQGLNAWSWSYHCWKPKTSL